MPEIRASNKRRSGGGCLPVMAAQMRQVTTFCRASERVSGEQRRRRRSGSRVARSFAGAEWGVIERSPGSLETHFPFPQNERSGRPTGQVQGKRGKLEARRGADDADGDDCVVGGGAAAVQTRSESRKNQGEDEGMCNHNQGERRTEQDPSLPVTARGQ